MTAVQTFQLAFRLNVLHVLTRVDGSEMVRSGQKGRRLRNGTVQAKGLTAQKWYGPGKRVDGSEMVRYGRKGRRLRNGTVRAKGLTAQKWYGPGERHRGDTWTCAVRVS